MPVLPKKLSRLSSSRGHRVIAHSLVQTSFGPCGSVCRCKVRSTCPRLTAKFGEHRGGCRQATKRKIASSTFYMSNIFMFMVSTWLSGKYLPKAVLRTSYLTSLGVARQSLQGRGCRCSTQPNPSYSVRIDDDRIHASAACCTAAACATLYRYFPDPSAAGDYYGMIFISSTRD